MPVESHMPSAFDEPATPIGASVRFRPRADVRGAQRARFDLGRIANELGLERVVALCSERFSATRFAADVRDSLGDRLVDIVVVRTAEPSSDDVRIVAAKARTGGPDGLLAIGSGSILSLAKLAVLELATEDFERFVWSTEPNHRTVSIPTLPDRLIPLIAMPTVAGSGSEVNQFAAVRHPSGRYKLSVRGPQLIPAVTVLDPELSCTAPATVTLGSAVNALSHCVEAIYSLQAQPFSDALALGAAGLIAASLPRCLVDPADMEARQSLLTASAMSSLAFSDAMLGLHAALCHAIAIRTEARYPDIQAVVFGHALRHEFSVISDPVERVCSAMGIDVSDAPSEALAGWVSTLGAPTRLREIGVPRDVLPELATIAAADRCLAFDPRAVPTIGQLLRIYEEAW